MWQKVYWILSENRFLSVGGLNFFLFLMDLSGILKSELIAMRLKIYKKPLKNNQKKNCFVINGYFYLKFLKDDIQPRSHLVLLIFTKQS